MRAEVAFAADDLARARFAVSPLWQTVMCLPAARPRGRPGSVPSVARRRRPAVRSAGLDRGWLAELVPAHGYLADLLTPYPCGDLDDELAAIRATDPARVRLELDMLAAERAPLDPARIAALRRDPVATLPLVTAEIAAFWDLAIAPHWPRIRAVLDADVLHRARQVAEHGTGHVLGDLHQTVTWDDGALHLVERHCEITRDGTGEGLLLLPERVRLGRGPDPRGPARAAAAVLPGARHGHDLRRRGRGEDRRAGRGARAHARPGPAVAGRPGIDHRPCRPARPVPCGVSEHLTAMRDAGLVRPHRAGRQVLYVRTPAADALVGAPV